MLWLRLSYPRLTITYDTRIERGCRISCANDSRMTIRHSHICALTTLKADSGGQLVLDSSFLGPGCVVVAHDAIRIGPGCQIAELVTIRDQDHSEQGFVTSPITIEDRVWIGAKASILRGTRIGADATVGAHAVVKQRVAARSTVVGIPARALD